MQLITKKECLRQITKIAKEIEHSNPNIKFTYNKNEQISRTYTKPIFDMEHNRYYIKDSKINIGLHDLYYAVPNAENQIDAKCLVDFTKVIFHEVRHAYQIQTLYQNANLDNYYKNMARKHLLFYYFPSYYENPDTPNNYNHSPFEIDAEQHGLLDTIKYFDTHFLDENGKPCYDAKTMLYEIYKDKDDDDWYLPKKYRQHGFDDMIKNMENYKNFITQKTEDFGFPKYDHNNPDDIRLFYITEEFLHNPIYQKHRIAFNNATVGTERDRVLLQVALHEDPAAATLFKGLSKECYTYLDMFKRTNPSTVISSRVLYSTHTMSKSDKQKQNAERIARAERICRNIAFDGTSYNPDDFHM